MCENRAQRIHREFNLINNECAKIEHKESICAEIEHKESIKNSIRSTKQCAKIEHKPLIWLHLESIENSTIKNLFLGVRNFYIRMPIPYQCRWLNLWSSYTRTYRGCRYKVRWNTNTTTTKEILIHGCSLLPFLFLPMHPTSNITCFMSNLTHLFFGLKLPHISLSEQCIAFS